MQISGKKPGVGTDNYVKKLGDNDQVKKQGSSDKPAQSDSVDISTRARDLSRVKLMLDSVPDVRSDMVVRLKTDIERGDYSVDAGKVAEKMLERALRSAINTKK